MGVSRILWNYLLFVTFKATISAAMDWLSCMEFPQVVQYSFIEDYQPDMRPPIFPSSWVDAAYLQFKEVHRIGTLFVNTNSDINIYSHLLFMYFL